MSQARRAVTEQIETILVESEINRSSDGTAFISAARHGHGAMLFTGIVTLPEWSGDWYYLDCEDSDPGTTLSGPGVSPHVIAQLWGFVY